MVERSAHNRLVVGSNPAEPTNRHRKACQSKPQRDPRSNIGTFSITIEVGDPRSEHFETVDALVDTGATHAVLPRQLTGTLGIAAVERLEFRLADQSIESYDVGEARVRLDGRERTLPVVFGPEGSPAPCWEQQLWRSFISPRTRSRSGCYLRKDC